MQTASVQIRHSSRAKHLRLSVRPGLIELVVPPKVAKGQALAFLEQHRAWAEGKLRELDEKARKLPAVAGFTANPSLPWRGQELPLRVAEEPGAKIHISVDEAVHIRLPQGLGENRDAVALRAFYAWARPRLRQQAAQLVARHAPRFGLHPREIRVKQMKTRWGSCGPRGDINLNWLLALAPEAVLEYVLVHEICHIRERNHSQAFWDLVAWHLPDCAAERRWLKIQGADLLRRFSL